MSPSSFRRKLIFTPVVAAISTAGCAAWLLKAWSAQRASMAVGHFRTAPVTRGDIIASNTANGTLNSVNIVSVGTQVSGFVSRIYVDYNDKGSALAEGARVAIGDDTA